MRARTLVAAVALVGLTGCGGLLGGASEPARIEQGEKVVDDVKDRVSDIEQQQDERSDLYDQVTGEE